MLASYFQKNTASTTGSRQLPSNTIANPRGDLKVITTQSGVSYDGPPIPSLFSSLPKVVELVPEVTKDTVQPNLATTLVNENCSTVILKKLPEKLGDPGKFSFHLSLPELNPTRMILKLADRSMTRPAGIAKDVFVKVGKFHFLTDFVFVDYVVDPRIPLILKRPFLRTGRALIDVSGEKLTLQVDDEAITFKVGQTSKYSYNDVESINRINVIDISCEEYVQEVLGFTDNSKSGNPTPISDPIIALSSPSLTPFEGGDFILKEIKACLTSKSIPPRIDDIVFNLKGDIHLLEKDCVCLIGTVEDKILVPKPPKNCARCTRCGYLVYGPNCQGCALLRLELEENLVTYSPDFQNISEPSDASTNVVNAPREPNVAKQDNGSFIDKIIFRAPDSPDQFHCFHCKDVLRAGETSESSFTVDPTPTYVDESPNVFNPPPQPSMYPCEFCGNDGYYGHYCTPQAPLIYPEQCYNQDFNFQQNFLDVPQQYPCCDDCGVTHDAYQCQPMTEVYYYGKQLEEEQAAKAKNWKLLVCYDDDDDEESSKSLKDNIIFELPPCVAFTPNEPVDSLIMGDEHINTISATESDEFIKSCCNTLNFQATLAEGSIGVTS
nr:reverse transcriptase domain-containing protein [Tanacetum cinerariifolium]